MTNVTRTYGTVSVERQKEMTGLEFVQGLATGTLPLNMIAKTLGYDVVEAEKGRVVVAVEPSEGHLNPYGTVHGGVTATLLDSCMGLAVQSMLDKGFGQTTVVQDFTHPANYTGHRTHHGRGRRVEFWASRWHG
jgi:acyl-coenzyme A thioesterase PaaI-like protein